jgi:hypothetical protein
LRLYAACRILEFSFSPGHVSQHGMQPWWSQYHQDARAARKGVGVTGCRVRHRCRWQRIRGLGLFSRVRRLPVRALADNTPLESAAAQLAANQPVRRGKTSIAGERVWRRPAG